MQNPHSLFRSRAIPLSFSNASVSANRSAPLSALSWPPIVFLPSRLSGGFLPSRLSGGPCHTSSDRHLLSKKYKMCCGKSRFGVFSCPSSLPGLRAASELNRSMVIFRAAEPFLASKNKAILYPNLLRHKHIIKNL